MSGFSTEMYQRALLLNLDMSWPLASPFGRLPSTHPSCDTLNVDLDLFFPLGDLVAFVFPCKWHGCQGCRGAAGPHTGCSARAWCPQVTGESCHPDGDLGDTPAPLGGLSRLPRRRNQRLRGWQANFSRVDVNKCLPRGGARAASPPAPSSVRTMGLSGVFTEESGYL